MSLLNISAIQQAIEASNYNLIDEVWFNKWVNCIDEDNPNMADTYGSLVDKLITVDLKMFFNQEKLYSIRKQSVSEFEKQWKDNLSELHAILKRCTDLNVQRARLVDEIDKKLSDALKGDIKPDLLSAPQHKTY